MGEFFGGPMTLLFDGRRSDSDTIRTYLIFGSFCFAMFVFVWFFVPETKGISLEAMDKLFGVTDAPEKSLTEVDTKDSKDAPRAVEREVA